jgi:hypothetical protein
MVNKAHVLENHRGVMERKRKLVRQYQSGSSSRPHIARLQSDLYFILLSHSFSQGRRQLDKDSLPRSIKRFNAPTISRLMLPGIRVFKGPKLPKICCKLIVGATTMVKWDIMPTDAPIHTLMLISPLQLHLPLPTEPTLFLLLPSRTTPVGE